MPKRKKRVSDDTEPEPEPEPESKSAVRERILNIFINKYLYDESQSIKFVDNIMEKYPFDRERGQILIDEEITEYNKQLTREEAKAYNDLASFFEYEYDDPDRAELKAKRSKKRKKKRKSKYRKSKRKKKKTKRH